jgi:CBS domain containing-hemolysin-like protein
MLRDSFEYDGRRYTVEEMEAHRIAKVRIEKTSKTEAEMETARHGGD